ncbi:hypothetical protein CLU99_0166 [Flavobacterium sp. 2]|nr:hypothetical protein CLU99_0166 [Flavobacterium sp. 2]
MEGILNLFYALVKLIFGMILIIPLILLTGIFDWLNTKGQFNGIIADLKSLLKWFNYDS